ncbi:MAG TPA: LytTR family DNA-binding domain-containing protein [Puia sp.]|nr:LytTR family DNA-binding domain-containing protein [Puia sp.]
MIRAIIIDDEEISLKALGEKVKANCNDVEVLKLYIKPEEALKEIDELKPDIVFLDIEMPKMNGFIFLKNCNCPEFEVIFTTAYSEYAIDALRISALDFLLKPINITELIAAVTRLKEKLKNKKNYQGMLEQQIQLFQHYQQPFAHIDKIALPVMNGLEFINAGDVIKVRGENVYSVFFLADGKKMVASVTLKEAEAMLQRFGFFRVHKSFIINLKYITRYIKGEGGIVVLSDGSEVEVSRRNKADFLKKIGG